MNEQNEQNEQESIQQIIAREFGFDDLDANMQEDLIMQMTESVIKRVLVDAYVKLSDSARTEFEQMMENIETIDPESIDAFLRANLTDYNAIIVEAVADLKKHIADASGAKA